MHRRTGRRVLTMENQPPVLGDRYRSAYQAMLYPDGTSVNKGDLIWWNEGQSVGYVQDVIKTNTDQRMWGLTQPHISIGGHPYRSQGSGFVVYPASDFADEGIGVLTAAERLELEAAIQHAQTTAGRDQSATDFAVQTEVSDGVQTAWLIIFRYKDG